MDMTFKCPHCDQELEVDSGGAGAEIECPACGERIVVPELPPDAAVAEAVNPIASSAAAKEERHFSVPVHDKPAEVLIKKAARPLEFAAKESDRKPRIRVIKHAECFEVGHDRFEEVVADFLDKVGETHLIKMDVFNYSHFDIHQQKILTDYGVLIFYKG